MKTLVSTLPVLALAAVALVGCSKKEPTAETKPDSKPATTTATPAKPATPPAANGTPAAIKAVSQQVGSAPLHLELKSAKTDHDGYLMTFEIQNKGAKEIKAIYYKGCTYGKDGKAVGGSPANGVDVDVKPNAKGEAQVYLGKQSESPAAATLAVTEIKYADSSKWEDHMASCPDTAKF